MKNWKHQLPVILLAFFEIAAGILLFLKPEEFTGMIIVGFGIVLLIFAVLYFVQFFTERKAGGYSNWLILILAVITLALGLICLFGSGFIVKLFAIPAILYGIFLMIAGMYKCRTFVALRRNLFPAPVMLIVSGILTICLGILLVIHPFESTMVLWRIAGVAWILSGVGDIISLILAARE